MNSTYPSTIWDKSSRACEEEFSIRFHSTMKLFKGLGVSKLNILVIVRLASQIL